MNHKYTVFSITAFAIATLISCKDENGNAMLNTAANPAIAYKSYLLNIRTRTDLSVQKLACELRRWQALDDSVSIHLQRNTQAFNSNIRSECDLLHDSIRTEFCRLALSRSRTFNDILYLQEYLSPYFYDEELLLSADNIEPFFESMNCQPSFSGNCEQTVKAYRNMLRNTLSRGIHGMDDLILFIRQEDAIFRTFLSHLNELGLMNVSDITRNTEQCCMLVFQAAEREELSYKEAMIYLVMRTNRRLLQNIQQCVNDIRQGKVKTAEQAQAYIWMLFQPYVSLNAFSIALLTPQERKTLHRIAIDTPGLFNQLNEAVSLGYERPDEIPARFVQMYISTL